MLIICSSRPADINQHCTLMQSMKSGHEDHGPLILGVERCAANPVASWWLIQWAVELYRLKYRLHVGGRGPLALWNFKKLLYGLSRKFYYENQNTKTIQV